MYVSDIEQNTTSAKQRSMYFDVLLIDLLISETVQHNEEELESLTHENRIRVTTQWHWSPMCRREEIKSLFHNIELDTETTPRDSLTLQRFQHNGLFVAASNDNDDGVDGDCI